MRNCVFTGSKYGGLKVPKGTPPTSYPNVVLSRSPDVFVANSWFMIRSNGSFSIIMFLFERNCLLINCRFISYYPGAYFLLNMSSISILRKTHMQKQKRREIPAKLHPRNSRHCHSQVPFPNPPSTPPLIQKR